MKSDPPGEPLSPNHKIAHRFFTSVIAWYDVLSTATTNLKPWAPRFCLDSESSGFITLETIIGCENSVILAIMEVASLNNWKVNAQRDGYVNVCELLERAIISEKSLEKVLEQNSNCETAALLPENERSNSRLVSWNQQSGDLEAMSRRANFATITCVFACAALVHLNVVAYGSFAKHPKIHGSVSRTMAALKQLHDPRTLGILAWPLCIAGCMASDWQTEFFKDIFLEFENVSDVKSGNLKRVSIIIEECWRLRRDAMTESVGWQQAMDSLNMKILLI